MISDFSNADLKNDSVPLKYRALILTAIPIEYNAIQKYFQELESRMHPNGDYYEVGNISLDGSEWEILIGLTGPHNTVAGIETQKAIEFFNPIIAIFVGVAGGLKDVELGDIVVSSKIYPYEYGKVEGEFKPRSDSRAPNYRLIRLAEMVSRENNWRKRILTDDNQSPPRVFVGPIVSGEKVIGDDQSYEYELIRRNYSDALAAEMEGSGFLEAAWRNNGLDALVIRGISDKCNKEKGEADINGSQEIAAANASAFAFEFLSKYQVYILQINQRQSKKYIEKETFSTQKSENQIGELIQTDSTEIAPSQKLTVSLDIVDYSQTSDYQQELDDIKKLIETYQPDKVLSAIDIFKSKNWESASDIAKYRIIANNGLAEIQLTNYAKGGNLLIEALQFNPNDGNALENAAVGFLLSENFANAIDYALKAVEKNPKSSRAYSVIIQSKSHQESIENIIPTLPEELIHSQEIAGAIGQCYFNAGNYVESSKWFEIAVNNAQDDTLSFKAIYASSLLNKVKYDKSALGGLQITKELRNDLEKSKSLFEDVITLSNNPTMLKAHIEWVIERDIVKRMLGLINKSSGGFVEAYYLDPTNPIAIYQKALNEFELGNFSESEELTGQILWNNSTPGSLWLYLNSLKSQKKFDCGISRIQEFEHKTITKEQEDLLNHYHIVFYLDMGEKYHENAESIAFSRYGHDKTNINKIIDLLNVYRIMKNNEKIETTINDIRKFDLNLLHYLQQIEIADLFFKTQHYLDASKIYSRLVFPSENTPLTQKLISSFYFIGDHRKALEYCKILHSHHGFQPYSSKIELAIYYEVGDIFEAEILCSQYLEKYPDDYEMKLNLATVNLRANEKLKVQSFLEFPYDFEKLSYESGSKIVNLFLAMSRYDEAIQLSFKIRNKNLDNPEVHLDYIKTILDVSDRSALLEKPEKVEINSVVQLEDTLKKTTSYILYNENIPDKIAIPLSITTPLGSQILNKCEGERINFEVPIGENFVFIKNILSKYVFAFQESVNNFSQQFIGHPGIFQMPIGSGCDGHITKEDIQNLRMLTEKNQKHFNTILNLYKNRQLTISGIAQHLNKEIFEVCSIISQKDDVGILSCYNCTPQENKDAKKDLEAPIRLVIDPVALYTIFTTNIGDFIVKKFGKFWIARSTVDLLRNSIFNLSGMSSQGYMTLGITDDSMTGYDVSAEQITTIKHHYEKFLDWVEQNCEILPCYELLSLDPNKKREYQSLFGPATLDTMLLASHENTLLYSDDGLIQGVAKQLYNVKSVWSRILLSTLYNENKCLKEALDEVTIKLLQQHLHPPIINSNILFNAAKKTQWQYISPFKEVVQLLGDIRLNSVLSIRIGADFVTKLWLKRIETNSRNFLLLIVLKTITQRREKSSICSVFVDYIQNNNELFDFEKNEIIEISYLYHDFLS